MRNSTTNHKQPRNYHDYHRTKSHRTVEGCRALSQVPVGSTCPVCGFGLQRFTKPARGSIVCTFQIAVWIECTQRSSDLASFKPWYYGFTRPDAKPSSSFATRRGNQLSTWPESVTTCTSSGLLRAKGMERTGRARAWLIPPNGPLGRGTHSRAYARR